MDVDVDGVQEWRINVSRHIKPIWQWARVRAGGIFLLFSVTKLSRRDKRKRSGKRSESRRKRGKSFTRAATAGPLSKDPASLGDPRSPAHTPANAAQVIVRLERLP
jgi:hypothetical protein